MAAWAAVSLVACVRTNPAYQQAGDSSATSASTTSQGSSGAEGEAASGAEATAHTSSASTGSGSCGDGHLDPGEECDDGNTAAGDACYPDCTVPVTVVDMYEPDPEPGVRARFNAVAVDVEGAVAVGRGVGPDGPDERPAVVQFHHDGSPRLHRFLQTGTWTRGEAFAVVLEDDEIFIAGLVGGQNQSAFAASLQRTDDDVLAAGFFTPIVGTRAGALVVDDEVLRVGTGEFDQAGLGFSVVSSASGQEIEGWVDEATVPSQVHAMVRGDQVTYGAGMLSGEAVVFELPDVVGAADLYPFVSVGADTPGLDRFQALLVDEEEERFVVGGSVGAPGGENAYLGSFGPAGAFDWHVVTDGGSPTDDEIEALAWSDDGDIIAGGMLGAPPQPHLWKVDAEDGAVQWAVELARDGFVGGYVRGVAVWEDRIYVVGERVADYTDSGEVETSIAFGLVLEE